MKKRITAFISSLVIIASLFCNITYADTALPEKFSSFDLKLLSPSQDQLTTSACWAFVHNELIQANVAKNTGVLYNFSEETMKFETSRDTEATWGFTRPVNGGGNEFISTAYLARAGSVLESDEPFTENTVRTADADALTRYGYLKSTLFFDFGVYDFSGKTDAEKEEVRKNKAAAIQKIKELVYNYGAVGAGMYFVSSDVYEDANKTNYYYDGFYSTPNHSVTIVGWDDNYSKEKFRSTPEADGAFIVKNTWGDYHNGGKSCYFYVSYYDKLITYQPFASEYQIQNTLYDNMYMYDGLGWTQNGYLNENSALCVTKFNANKKNEAVTAVSTYVANGGTTVDVYINAGNGDMRDQNAYTKVKTVFFEDAGYYLIEIDPIPLKKSEYYVGIRHTTNAGRTEFPIQTQISGLTDGAVNTPDTCFVATEFDALTAIEDIYPKYEAMNCIKAFTKSLSDTAQPSGKIFTDVESKKWYADEIEYCVSHGIFSGVTENTFEPQTQMTRAMFVKVLYNLSGDTIRKISVPFTDVKSGRWYTDAVGWGYKNGIVSGIDKLTFAPDTPITREQMCYMLTRFTDYMGIKLRPTADKKAFTDESRIRKYAKSAVALCQTSGIINGNTDGSFAPNNSATRAEVAVMLTNLCQKYIY